MAIKSVRWLAITLVCACCSTCTITQAPYPGPYPGQESISENVNGVKANSPAAHGRNIRKGGGRYVVGKSYVVKGKRYDPKEEPNYDRNGVASWYGSAFHGRRTANGEVYNRNHLTAAHPSLPLPSYVRVTNLENGSSLIVRVNDRGPYHKGRIIDLSSKAADMLDLKHRGTAAVRVQYVGRARLGGHDMPYLMASYVKKGVRVPDVGPEPRIANDVMVASDHSAGSHVQSDSQSPRSIQTSPAGHTQSASYGTRTVAAAGLQPVESLVMSAISPVTFERMPGYAPSMPQREYCPDKYENDGVPDTCEVQALLLPAANRNVRLAGVIAIWRRRARRLGWQGTTITLA